MAKAMSQSNPRLVFRDKDDSCETERGSIRQNTEVRITIPAARCIVCDVWLLLVCSGLNWIGSRLTGL